jgi:hypothetical protein
MYFLERLHPGSYAITSAYHLWGPLDVAALARALSAIVQRHEILRTTYRRAIGATVQVVGRAEPVDVGVVPLKAGTNPSAALDELIENERRRPFDLAHGPVLRARLLRTSASQHVLLLSIHHIATDEWSQLVFRHELVECYASELRGRPANVAPLPLQYGDYAVWQQEWLRGSRAAGQLEHWNARLSGVTPARVAPDADGTVAGGSRTCTVQSSLSAHSTARLRELAARAGCTLYMLSFAAWAAVLSRDAGRCVVVGCPVVNRARLELRDLIGYFGNTVALCIDLAGDPTAWELLRRSRETCLAAYEHEEIPFDKVVATVCSAREASHNRLFQLMLVVRSRRAEPPQLAGLRVTALPLRAGAPRHDLRASMLYGGRLSISLEGDRRLFLTRTCDHLVQCVARLLEDLAEGGDRRLSQLPALAGRGATSA